MGFLQLAALTGALALCYAAALAIFRLFFHPLSKFPGPKLAACSLWYEFYYDCILEGTLVWKIKKMHDIYGPVVRINPNELHIRDPDFYQDIYAPTGGGKKRNKYQWWVNLAGAPGSIFATVDHDVHRMRRAPLNGFFSKKAVVELEPLISSKVQKLKVRFSHAAERGEIVRVDCAFMALTMDVICTFCFGSDRGYLDTDNFGHEWKETINGAWEKGALMRAFPFVPSIMRRVPLNVAFKLDPGMGRLLAWQASVEDAVKPIVERRDEADEKSQRSIFHALRDSDLPPEERTARRLSDEGIIFTGAGSETTAKTLTHILYHLVTNPGCMQKLKEELRAAMPNPSQLANWRTLEQLPYISAVIQEGVRMSYGITTRLPRVAPEALQYKEWTIPAGTPVSETPYFVLVDPDIFPEPEQFKPERWLDQDQRLDKYMVSFGKGSRQCIGINLAYAEMYLTCATIYRQFNFELYDTTHQAVEMAHDFFVAAPEKAHRGVKVKIFVDT